jgi:hypothetical protein
VRAVSSYRQGCLVFPFEDAPSKGGPEVPNRCCQAGGFLGGESRACPLTMQAHHCPAGVAGPKRHAQFVARPKRSEDGPVARAAVPASLRGPVEHGIFPPDEQTIEIQRQAGHRVVPGAIIVLDGAGAGGPEQAGALSLV